MKQDQNWVRETAVAGQFYPGVAHQLISVVQDFLDGAAAPDAENVPKAIIAPQAGYVYSGVVAATAYARLAPAAATIKRVVLLGPCHRVAVQGLALSGAGAFRTPLGDIPVDKDAAARILDFPQVEVFDAEADARLALTWEAAREHALTVTAIEEALQQVEAVFPRPITLPNGLLTGALIGVATGRLVYSVQLPLRRTR